MASAIPQQRLAEIVREARARTGVPAVAAGLLVGEQVELAADGPVEVETPFRIASITKWFTASLAALLLDLDTPLESGASARRLLSHMAGLRRARGHCSPRRAAGSGRIRTPATCSPVRRARRRRARPSRTRCSSCCSTLSGSTTTGFEEPPDAARGHVQEGATGQRPAPEVVYPEPRRAAGGLWSTVGDLLRFATHQLGRPGPLSAAQLAKVQEPQAEALGARYCLGCWSRKLAGGRAAFDHEGSVGGYQSLLLIAPEEETALAVLTNSWRGSGLIRRVVRDLGLVPGPVETSHEDHVGPGRYALDDPVAVVSEHNRCWRVAESETDPLTGVRIERPEYAVDPLGGGVYGFAGGLLMSHRVDFPRDGIARVGWTALPAANS